MANLQIKNLPEELHGELRRRAALEGKSLRDYVLDLIRKDQEFPTMREWLDSLEELEPIELGDDAYAAIDRDRVERDREWLRRVEGDRRDTA
jgi:antitoxin FitA